MLRRVQFFPHVVIYFLSIMHICVIYAYYNQYLKRFTCNEITFQSFELE